MSFDHRIRRITRIHDSICMKMCKNDLITFRFAESKDFPEVETKLYTYVCTYTLICISKVLFKYFVQDQIGSYQNLVKKYEGIVALARSLGK